MMHAPHPSHPPDPSGGQRQGLSESGRIGLAFWLNAGFAIIELIGGLLTNSVAILADAVHDLGDSLAIALGWGAARLAGRTPDQRYTYGYRRLSLLSAAINGAILLLGSIWVMSQALPRLWAPELPHTGGMFALAVLGVAMNGAGAIGLRGGRTLNERMLSWHLLEDMLGWLAVLVGSVVMHFTGWAVIDPLLSLGVTLLILFNVARNLRQTARLFLQRTPDPALTEQVRQRLEAVPLITGSHHLHLWSLDGDHHVLTAHLIVAQELTAAEQRNLKGTIDDALRPFGLAHTTIELELPAETCRDSRVTPHPPSTPHRH